MRVIWVRLQRGGVVTSPNLPPLLSPPSNKKVPKKQAGGTIGGAKRKLEDEKLTETTTPSSEQNKEQQNTEQNKKTTNKKLQQVVLRAPKQEDNPKIRQRKSSKVPPPKNTPKNHKTTDLFRKQITSNNKKCEITSNTRTDKNNTNYVHMKDEDPVQYNASSVQQAEVVIQDPLCSTDLRNFPANKKLPDLDKKQKTFTFTKNLVLKNVTK